MTAHIQCKGSGGVSQILLYRFHVIPFLQCGDGISMTKIVETCVRSSDPGSSGFEASKGVCRLNETPHRIGENKIPFIFPCKPGSDTLIFLFPKYFFQNLHDERRNGQNADSVVF